MTLNVLFDWALFVRSRWWCPVSLLMFMLIWMLNLHVFVGVDVDLLEFALVVE